MEEKRGKRSRSSGVSDRDETIIPVDEVTNSSFLPPHNKLSVHGSMVGRWSDSLLPFKTTIVWYVASQESHENCCHQMSNFKAKMHQIRFGLGLRPRPCWGAYSTPPDFLAGFKGPYY